MNDFATRPARTYLEYKLTNVVVTSLNPNGANNLPVEPFSFGFEEIPIRY